MRGRGVESVFTHYFYETGHQVRRQAGKIIKRKKEKASVSSAGEETVYQPKEQIRPVPPSGGEKALEQGKELAVKKIKTVERDKRTIKTGRTSEQVVKNTGKGTIKTSGKAVKTAEQTARTSIKTSEQTANASVQAMHYSMKKAEKAVQAARQTAQNTRIAVKTTAKAVTHAIKALMEATKALLSGLTAGGWIAVVILMIVILFGGFLCMTGGDNSSTVSSVSAEVPHVLQYYAFGRIPTGIGNQAIVQVAASQEGKGGTTYWSWYGFGSRVEWCACFVSWCADQSGYIQSGVIPKFSLCSDGVRWFESKGRFRDGSYTPAAGDIIFFDWGNNGTIDHVGIVESVSGGTVNTIEGNSGDKVARRNYSIGSSNIYGYGVPSY